MIISSTRIAHNWKLIIYFFEHREPVFRYSGPANGGLVAFYDKASEIKHDMVDNNKTKCARAALFTVLRRALEGFPASTSLVNGR